MSINILIEDCFNKAFTDLGFSQAPPIIQNTARVEHGDYQVNGIMPLAKAHKQNPRELAKEVLAKIRFEGLAEKLEIAGPGFINIFLSEKFLADYLKSSLDDVLLGLSLLALQNKNSKILIDYSSPNLAKEMHVGHLRSTIIGDSLVRVYEWLGYNVHRANHVGDWGTQFGMLVAYLAEINNTKEESQELLLNDLEKFYRLAKERFDSDEVFANKSREFVVRLQSGDGEVLELWQKFVKISLAHCQQTYELLGVGIKAEHTFGESFYNNDLANVVAELKNQTLLVENAGAMVVFLDKNIIQKTTEQNSSEKDAVIIQKRDGGYLYSTTDLAAIRYRNKVLRINQVLYVVDSRQSQHFDQVFRLAKKAGFAPENMQLQHIAFGMVLGEDGKPFKTRDGGTVKLIDLLYEAIERAYKLVREKNPNKDEQWLKNIAKVVGIGAVKYADLSKSRQSDYIFNWDSMLSFEGNTAPYLQYAYTRIQSVFRKAGINPEGLIKSSQEMILSRNNLSEWQLSIALARFSEIISLVVNTKEPHHLCGYLYNLAVLFSRFYESEAILKTDEIIRNSRLQICALTAKTLKQGLNLLGIEVLDEM